MKVSAVKFDTRFAFPEGTEIVRVEYGLGVLSVYVEDAQSGIFAKVVFSSIEAYRVMDERDLQDYWPVCSFANGWIFEIQNGGWLSSEMARCGGLTAQSVLGLREYMVTGVDDCISILSSLPPEVT
jgi:hypothetical protein